MMPQAGSARPAYISVERRESDGAEDGQEEQRRTGARPTGVGTRPRSGSFNAEEGKGCATRSRRGVGRRAGTYVSSEWSNLFREHVGAWRTAL